MPVKSSIFRTEVTPRRGKFDIRYQSNILCLGSCFVQNIRQKLLYYKFPTLLNPFGALYNPASISRSFDVLLDEERVFSEKDVFQHQGVWNSFHHHSDYSDTNRDRHLKKINEQLRLARQWLKKADVILVTPGTSFVYEHLQTNSIVANCHKLPEKEFRRYMLPVEQTSHLLHEMIRKVTQLNSAVQFIFTVSPVRHLRDGSPENMVSKSQLIVAVNEVVAHNKNADYFPSYEIMMDDLRDYRFYEEDMVHPNQIAINYIWDKFKGAYVSKAAMTVMEKVEKIQQAVSHRPRFRESSEHQKFIQQVIAQIDSLPDMDFSKEKGQLLDKG